jgi:chromosome partitioning protein
MITSLVWSSGSAAIADVRTIVISNNKGGSGKTTTTVSVAAAFAERGLRILVVDLDPQGSATDWLGGSESPLGLIEFSAGNARLAEIVVDSTAPGVQLLPISPSLTPPGDADPTAAGIAIARGFARLPDYWDLVLIDTPPTLGHLSIAPLVAAEEVVIPVEAHGLALRGVASTVESTQRARARVNSRLHLLGIVVCRVNATSHARDIVERLQIEFGDGVLSHRVRESIDIAEAPGFKQPITRYAPNSPVVQDYRGVAGELLDRLGDLRSR